MRKSISTILVLTMVLSLFVSFGANAAHWAQDAIDYVTSNGYWIAPQPIEPDKPATRAETASLFARILVSKIPEYTNNYEDVSKDNIYSGDIAAVTIMELMLGYDGKFRPDDTLTREELAVILDRASKLVSDDFKDVDYEDNLLKDFEEISDWAQKSVGNSLHYVLMKGMGGKRFAPKETTTLAEVATVVKSLAEYSEANNKIASYLIREVDASDNIEEDFDVLQSAGIWPQAGIVGYGMLARFNGAPGKIYVARTTTLENQTKQLESMGPPPVVCKIIGPDGFTVCRVNLYDKQDGTMEKIVEIPEGEPGIYRIQFVGGLKYDVFTIGVQEPESWGVFGEPEFMFTESTPKKSYFWVPEKYETICLGIAQKEPARAAIFGPDGGQLFATGTTNSFEDGNAQRLNMNTLEPGEVYSIEVTEDFRGRFGLIGGSPLICPTAEMAADLKGGFVYYEDEYISLQTFGPLQAKARARMTEIYNEMGGNFDVDVTVPENPPETLDNPRAESMLYAAYGGSLQGIENTLENQMLDPTSPFFGMYMGLRLRGEREWPTVWWEHCSGNPNGDTERNWLGKAQFSGALTHNAETNYWYGNYQIQKRVELQFLAWALTMNPGGALYGRSTTNNALVYYWTQTQFYLGEHGMPSGYAAVRNFLSPKTRVITDQAISEVIEHMMNGRGQGVTNQMLCSTEAALFGAQCFPEYSHFLDKVNFEIIGTAWPCSRPNYLGQTSPLGYWCENGCDASSYGRMNEGIWDTIVFTYLNNISEEKQDPYAKAKLIEATERFLKFDSMFYAPAVGPFRDYNSSVYTSRIDSPYGNASTIAGNSYLIKDFPRAKANWVAGAGDTFDPTTVGADGSLNVDSSESNNKILNDGWAMSHIKYNWYRWGKAFRESAPNDYQASISEDMYLMWHTDEKYDESEIPVLPFAEDDYFIYKLEGGAVAAKHKGIYFPIFYSNDLNYISGYSWHHAAPLQIWDEYFSTVMSSQKPHSNSYQRISSGQHAYNRPEADYRGKFSLSEIVSAGVVGKHFTGELMIEGKEHYNEFSWLEEGKSFRITGQNHYGGKQVVWDYYLTEEGVTIEGGATEIKEKDDLWIQLPLIDRSSQVEGFTLTYYEDEHKVVFAHDGKTLTFEWEEGTESQFLAKRGEASIYRELLIKLTPEKPQARVKIYRDVGDYEFIYYGTKGI